MRKKRVKILACVFLFVFLFVHTAGAWLPAAIVLGTVLRTSSGVIITHVVRNQLAYSILGGLLTGLGYVAYDRGSGVDPAKRYINVPLTESKATVEAQKTKVISENPDISNVVWASGVTYLWQGASLQTYTYTSVPAGAMACKMVKQVEGAAAEFVGYTSSVVTGACSGNFTCNYPYYYSVVCSSALVSAYPNSAVKDKIYTNADLKKYYQEALGRDLSKGGIVESASPASNSLIVGMGADVYETDNYTDARDMIESGVEGETTRDAEITGTAEGTSAEVEPLPVPPVSDGTCGDYTYKNNWDSIKSTISTAINALPLYSLINKLADLTGQAGFPHQYHLDLSAVGLGSADLDLDAFHFASVLAVIRWAVLAGGFILAWRIAVGGD